MKPNPRVTMIITGSSLLLAAVGLVCLFAPDFVAPRLGGGAATSAPVQLAAGGLLGFGALNWIGRNAVYGGIYGRPIVLANFLNGMILCTTLARLQFTPAGSSAIAVLAILFGLYTLAFAVLLFRPPAPVGD